MPQTARKSPEFLDRAVIYQLFLRAFTPEGTLTAAARLLPHLADIGVDIVYLCPIAEADDDNRQDYWSERQKKSQLGNPKNPYRMKDFYTIDPEYGTTADLAAFVRQAHKLGLKVMLDLVYLHCGPQAVFIESHPDFVQRTASGDVLFGHWHFPLLNFASAGLREYLWQNMAYFVEKFAVDGYRCDVGDGVPLDFWEEARRRLDPLKPDLVMLNEGTKPEYLLRAFDLNYDFHWSGVLGQAFRGEIPASAVIDYWRESGAKRPAGGRCIRALDNHDIANDSYENRIEQGIGPRAVEAALLVNHTLDGVPFLYNGYEVVDTIRHSIFGNRFHGANLTIDWSGALTATGQKRLLWLRELNQLRHSEPALATGDVQWLEQDQPDAVLAFTRTCAGQRLAVVVNTRPQPLTVQIKVGPDFEPGEVLIGQGAEGAETRPASAAGTDVNPDCWRVDLLPYGCLVAEY